MFDDLAKAIENQIRVKSRLIAIHKELESISPPKNPDTWMSSIPEIGATNRFTMKDFKRVLILRREMEKLREEEDHNIRAIRMHDIDRVLGKISKAIE